MTEQNQTENIVLKPREPFSDVILSENASELARFMDQPLSAIAEIITGWLASGPKSWTTMTGRIVQAILKGKMFEQVSREIKELREKGKIPDDYADKKYGFQSWVELLKVIDEETPDADKLDALKAMFYAVNKIGIDDAERIVNYQLFQIAKRLTSNQLLIMKAVYETLSGGHAFGSHNQQGPIPWADTVAARLKHGLSYLVLKEEPVLLREGLIKDSREVKSNHDSRLTDLGTRFCETIRKYHIETTR